MGERIISWKEAIVALGIGVLAFSVMYEFTMEYLYTTSYNFEVANATTNPDLYFLVPDVVRRRGYPIEEHFVQTQDGYNLTLHRINGGQISNDTVLETRIQQTKRPAVLVMHGLLSSSADFVVAGNLSYFLADRGYDVWLGNFRGNTYSKQHISFGPFDSEFWDFSLDQLIQFDLPTMIDYVLNKSESKSIDYIGHSMGANTLYALISERPEYNSKIRTFTSMAPGVYIGKMRHFFGYPAAYWKEINTFLGLVGVNQMFPNYLFGRILSDYICGNTYTRFVCSRFMSTFGSSNQVNLEKLPEIYSHYPAGTSRQLITHFSQLFIADDFQMFDFGEEENLEVYGKLWPRKYNISSTTVPVYVFYSSGDTLAPIQGVLRMTEEIPNLKEAYKIPVPFSHVDFMWGKIADKIVYEKIVENLKSSVS